MDMFRKSQRPRSQRITTSPECIPAETTSKLGLTHDAYINSFAEKCVVHSEHLKEASQATLSELFAPSVSTLIGTTPDLAAPTKRNSSGKTSGPSTRLDFLYRFRLSPEVFWMLFVLPFSPFAVAQGKG